MGRLKSILFISALILAVSVSVAVTDNAVADNKERKHHDDDHDEAYQLLQSGKVLPLETILEISRLHVQGRILEVELEHEKGLLIYELEILDDNGMVWELKVDAKTGALIKKDQD